VTHVILGDLSTSSVNMALLILRVTVGAVFLAHGINHIYGGGKIAGTARWFESLGMKPGILHAWMASLVEVAAGAALVLGLFTPIAAAGVVGVMLVAFITNHMKNGFFIFRPGEGYEYVMTLTLVAVAIGTIGPGQWSIDGHISALQDLWGWPVFSAPTGARRSRPQPRTPERQEAGAATQPGRSVPASGQQEPGGRVGRRERVGDARAHIADVADEGDA
jgi:putative oxidoreductase